MWRQVEQCFSNLITSSPIAIFGGWFMAYINPSSELLTTVFCFVLCDFILGITASKTTKVPITSSGLRRGAAKILCYLLLVVLAHAAQTSLGVGWELAKFMSGYIMVTELISILENIAIITGDDGLVELISVLKIWKKRKTKEAVEDNREKFKSDKYEDEDGTSE